MRDAATGETEKPVYGVNDGSFIAAGGEEGVFRLVNRFYDIMYENPKYRYIYDMHPDGEVARDKLARFLCGWMGGPTLFREKYGAISIPQKHSHLGVTAQDRDNWLACMAEALDEQDYAHDFKVYLIEQLSYPAELIRKTQV